MKPFERFFRRFDLGARFFPTQPGAARIFRRAGGGKRLFTTRCAGERLLMKRRAAERLYIGRIESLLDKVSPIISKQNTHLRESISAAERLSLTLRHLATGKYAL